MVGRGKKRGDRAEKARRWRVKMEDGRWKLTDAGPGADPAVVVVEIGEQ